MPRFRLHSSTVVLAFIIAILLVVVCVPGRIVEFYPGYAKTFEHGWPLVYLRRQIEDSTAPPPRTGFTRREMPRHLPMLGVPWLALDHWFLWQARANGDSILWRLSFKCLAADALAVVILFMLFVVAWEFRRRRRPHLLSFALADLLVATTAICMVLGYYVISISPTVGKRTLTPAALMSNSGAKKHA
jgi:heme/copper-type cytochrome/quinol oxidase subunit 2